MIWRSNRRTLIGATVGIGLGAKRKDMRAVQETGSLVLVTDSWSNTITWLDLGRLEAFSLIVGRAPWGMARVDERLWVSTAEGVAVVDLDRRSLEAMVPFELPNSSADYGEYREGGMGIAASADGSLVFVGNYLVGGDRLEVIDGSMNRVIGSAPIGIRAFDVLCDQDGSTAWSIDHDSYTVTAVDSRTLTTETWPVSPLGDINGLAGFEKPHYAVRTAAGDLLLPFQGQALAIVDTDTGSYEWTKLTANTHQHGITQSRDGQRLYIVGTGPAGNAAGPASLAIVDLLAMTEEHIPLSRPHERIALSADERFAFLTGGYSFAHGGWDGITIIDLGRGEQTEIAVGSQPMDILVLD